MDRCDAVTLGPKDRERLDDALDAVTDLLNTVPPGRTILELTRANGLLRQVVDCMRTAKRATERESAFSGSFQNRTHSSGNPPETYQWSSSEQSNEAAGCAIVANGPQCIWGFACATQSKHRTWLLSRHLTKLLSSGLRGENHKR